MEALEAISEDASVVFSERFASRVNASSIHLMYDHDKLQTINFILSKVPEITHIYNLPLVKDMESHKSTYTGQIIENIKWGIGIEEFKTGFKYYGEYENGQPNGLGLLVINDHQHYKGLFKNGQFHGEGEFHSANDYYIGEWYKNLKHGHGEELCQRTLYKGWFNIGSKFGKGKLFVFDRNLDELETELQNDYAGTIRQLKRFAVFVYSGEFQNDLFHGKGKIKMRNEETVKRVRGLFEKGRFVDGDIKFNDNSPLKNVTGAFAEGDVKWCEITFEDGKVVRGIGTNYK